MVNCSHGVVVNFLEGGSAYLTWWPDLTLSEQSLHHVGNEGPLKVRKFQLAISSRLAMAHEKPEGAYETPLPGIGLNYTILGAI